MAAMLTANSQSVSVSVLNRDFSRKSSCWGMGWVVMVCVVLGLNGGRQPENGFDVVWLGENRFICFQAAYWVGGILF